MNNENTEAKEIVSDGKFVSVCYKLYVQDDSEPWEEAPKSMPFNFTCGKGMTFPAFENSLKGLAMGDSFKFKVSKEDAHGEYVKERVIDLDKNIFYVDGKFDENQIKKDAIIPMMDAEGNRMNGVVVEVRKDTVVMDFNHPLAGKDLTFEGEVLVVRNPTAEELAVLNQPHKCGHYSGHCDDCSGGCGDGCSDCDGGDCAGDCNECSQDVNDAHCGHCKKS